MVELCLVKGREDVLRLYDEGELLGEVTRSGDDEWAAYRARGGGYIVEKRVGTFKTLNEAIKSLPQSVEELYDRH